MILHPDPGGTNYRVQLLELRFPSQLTFDFIGAGHKHRGIARPARSKPKWNVAPRYRACRLDDLEHRVTVAAASQVVDRTAVVQKAKRKHVGARKIDNMDVVSHAGSVGRGIVVTVDLDEVPACGGRLEYQRDQMGFRMVRFAAAPACPSGVEVAQRNMAQTVSVPIPLQRALKSEFGFAVRVGRIQGISLVDWLFLPV